MLLLDGFSGLGTRWWIELPNQAEPAKLSDLQCAIESVITQFEKSYSRFKPDSIISELNQKRLLSNPSPELIQLLEIGRDFYTSTNGLFNPALGGVLENRGYDAQYSFTQKSQTEFVPDYDRLVQIEGDKIILNGNGRLDLGGLGKGFLIDRLGEILEQAGFSEFIVNGGGDMLVRSPKPQQIILENPFEEGYSIGLIELRYHGLGCSSNLKRAWRDPATGRVLTHLIDPLTNRELPPIGSFVVAKNALIADVLATLVCLLAENPPELKRLQDIYRFEWAVLHPDMRLVRSGGFPDVKD